MDARIYFDLVQRQYDQETRDNEDLFRRLGFAVTGILVIGTAAATLTNGQWIKTLLPRVDVVAYLASIVLVFAGLVVSIVFIVRATLPRDWECPWPDHKPLLDAAKAHQKACSEMSDAELELLRTLAKAVEDNRHRNIERYCQWSNALRCIFASLCLLGLQALLHAVVYLRGP